MGRIINREEWVVDTENMESYNPGKKAANFVLGSLVSMAFSTVFFGLLSSPVILLALGNPPKFQAYAVLGVAGAGIFLGHHILHLEPGETESTTGIQQAALFFVYFILYNGILFLAILFGSVVGGGAGVLVALAYPAYEFKSLQYKNPLAFTGVILWIGIITETFVVTARQFVDGVDAAAPMSWILQAGNRRRRTIR